MTDFNTAFANFIAAVNEDQAAYYEKFGNLTFGEGEDDYAKPVIAAGGRKYIKLTQETGSQNFVYAFVAAVDVPAKNVKAGDVLKAAGWKAPELSRKNPAAANIFDVSSYENETRVGRLALRSPDPTSLNFPKKENHG